MCVFFYLTSKKVYKYININIYAFTYIYVLPICRESLWKRWYSYANNIIIYVNEWLCEVVRNSVGIRIRIFDLLSNGLLLEATHTFTDSVSHYCTHARHKHSQIYIHIFNILVQLIFTNVRNYDKKLVHIHILIQSEMLYIIMLWLTNI